ncbi:alpha/beta hydrolase [Flavobacterium sp. LPB0248]|uniref:alpha/beta fold hydrolase n=1 Tax=Flavobacterium sp. LPB0248 TaxID=2614441 RepID=UPI0015A5DDB1|nr:alpha/beta hydrolase [Flavobacterium sp. LPB0248]QLC64800.1 alpha/beta hydrolase [Flavobacterium sp. LPB0248]
MKKTIFTLLLACIFASLHAQKTYFITSSDKVQLSVSEYGQGKPVVLLAGGPGMTAAYLEPIWKTVIGYRFVVPDQRTTGKSLLVKFDATTLSVDKYVEDVEVLRTRLKLPKITIVGHSWGGMLAIAYAAKYPDKVEKLVLLNSGGVTANFFTYFSDNIMMRLHEIDFEESKKADSTGLNQILTIWPGYFFSRERALATKSDLSASSIGQKYTEVSAAVSKDYAITSKARATSLKKYTAPVTIIQGRQDPVGESTAFETKELLPQTKIHFIEKCGHFPWLEKTPAVNNFFTLLKDELE